MQFLLKITIFVVLGVGGQRKFLGVGGPRQRLAGRDFGLERGGCNMESWNASSTPCCQRWKNEVFLINYFSAVSYFPFFGRKE